MRTLIVEPDQPTAQLLETVTSGLRAGARVTLTRSLEGARRQLMGQSFDLILTAWNLQDGSGLDLARGARKDGVEAPIVMVSKRSDRRSVLMAAASGVNHYICKPFSVQLVRDRLMAAIAGVVDSMQSGGADTLPVEQLLEASIEWVGQLPTQIEPVQVLELMEQQARLSPRNLADIWREEIGLIGRILDVANSASFRRSGRPVTHLKDAISSLGVLQALNQALALSLDVSNQMGNPELKQLAGRYLEQSLEVAKAAQWLALRRNMRSSIYPKSGLLSRVGELAVLKVLNEYRESGGTLAEGEAEQHIGKWAPAYGNKIKVRWRLPLDLRNMIGAVHFLHQGTVSVHMILMHAAGMIADDRQNTPECQALLRRIGLVGEQG